MDEKRRKATRVVGRGEKRGAITGERHSYRIWAQISLIITACTATFYIGYHVRDPAYRSQRLKIRRPVVCRLWCVTDDDDGRLRL